VIVHDEDLYRHPSIVTSKHHEGVRGTPEIESRVIPDGAGLSAA
jgi:hypothetical protein